MNNLFTNKDKNDIDGVKIHGIEIWKSSKILKMIDSNFCSGDIEPKPTYNVKFYILFILYSSLQGKSKLQSC